MTATQRPASLVPGWQGAWAFNERFILTAIRDDGPLTFREVANVLIGKALLSDLLSGHNRGEAHGREMLARAVLEDAAEIITQTPDGRYSIAPDVISFTSPYTGKTYRLLTPDEQAAARDAESWRRPVRHWSAKGIEHGRGFYNPHSGRWRHGLPGRKHDAKELDEMANQLQAMGWMPGARIVKDQNGVIIDGHLRHEALRMIGIEPDVDPTDGEPYVEIRSFDSDAARLLFALTANWTTLKHDTRLAVGRAIYGGKTVLTLDHVNKGIKPVADLTRMPTTTEVEPEPEPEARVLQFPGPEPSARALKADDLRVLDVVRETRGHGVTYQQIVTPKGLGRDNDAAGRWARRRLAWLENAGKVVRLADKRDGCAIFVCPEYVEGRSPGARRAEVVPTTPEVVWSNQALAEMPFEDAYPLKRGNGGRTARIVVYTGTLLSAPTREHIPTLVERFTAEYPGLLDMMCDYRAATKR